MKIFVRAKPRAKKAGVQKIDDTHFIVSVKEPPSEGRANWAIERTLAEYFKVPVSGVRIVSGHSSRDKIIEIGE